MRPWFRTAIGISLGLLLCAWTVAGAFAHVVLLGTDPVDGGSVANAPEQIRLFFSEPLEPGLFSIQVFGADRARIDRNDTTLSLTDPRVLQVGLQPAPAGTYTVSWRALSLDGHVVRGTFAYAVGAGVRDGPPVALTVPAEGVPFPAESAVRWLTFLLTFLLLGGFAFRPLLLDPVLQAVRPAPDTLTPILVRRWLWLAWTALGLSIAVSVTALLFQASSAAGVPLGEVLSDPGAAHLLLSTRYGGLWGVRLGLLIGIAGTLGMISTDGAAASRVLWWLGAALSALILLTMSASGHASAVLENPALAILLDWLHMAAGGLWIGGLVHLGLTVTSALAQVPTGTRRAVLGRLVPRFSLVAGASVTVLVATGIYTSLIHVSSVASLTDTMYGSALTIKLLLFAGLLLLATINLLVMRPRFRKAIVGRQGQTEDDAGFRIFRWLVLGEILVAVAVLAATGVLTGLPPAGSAGAEARPFVETKAVDALQVTLVIRPNQAGQNSIEITLSDANNALVDDAQRVDLTLTMLDMEMGSRIVTAADVGLGQFEVVGSQLNMSGQWRADVSIRRPATETAVQFAVLVGAAPIVNRPAFSPGQIAINAMNGRTFLALAVIVAAIVLLARRDNLRRRDRRWAGFAAGGLSLIGLMVGGTSVSDAYRRSLPNPIPVTAESLARGEEVYQGQCASCHGITGRGDGPDGALLRPLPADFRVHMAEGHTDPDLFAWVTDGVTGTDMPAFGEALSEEDRWHVISYIRQFGNGGSSRPTAGLPAQVLPAQSAPVPTASPPLLTQPQADPTARGTQSVPAASPAATTESATGAPSAAIPPSASPAPSPSTAEAVVVAAPAGEPIAITPVAAAVASPAARSAPGWTEIGRWKDGGLMTTKEFTVRGPWRIRWQLENTIERCYVMIEEAQETPVLLSGPPGAMAGSFFQEHAGTYRLMLHNTTPYEIVVEEATP